MAQGVRSASHGRVLLVGPVPPPYGGMALQILLLHRLLREDGTAAELLGYNEPFSRLKFLEGIPGVSTLVRAVWFWGRFWKRARKTDVVHILAASWFYFFSVVCPAVVMARLLGKRVVMNYRAGDADEFFKACGWLARPFFKMSHVTSAPSKFLGGVIERRIGVPVSIVPNIVNFSLFKFRKRLEFRPNIIVTRHLEEIYGVESVVRAFRQVQAKYPEAALWIAGTGIQETRLRNLVAEWDLKNVQFIGYVNHKTLPSFYDQCDILVNGSQVDNFPGSLMEGSASGLVIVSTTAGGIPHIYEDGKTALLVNVGDWQQLGLAIERVLEDQELAHRLVSNGAELCRQCEWSSVRQKLQEVYGFELPREEREAEGIGADFVLDARKQ